MSKRFFYNILAILFVILFLSAIISHAYALPLLLRQIVTSTASRAAYHRAAIETAKAIKIAKDARALATINTGRVVGTNGQIVRFAFQTGITGGAIAAIAAIAAQRIGLEFKQLDQCPEGGYFWQEYNACYSTPYPELELVHAPNCNLKPSGTCSTAESYNGVIQVSSSGNLTLISQYDPDCNGNSNPDICEYKYEKSLFVSDPGESFDPDLPNYPRYYDIYGNPVSDEMAERMATEMLNVPWPDHADPLIQNVLTMPTENEINQSFQNLKNNLASDVEQVEIAQESSVITAIGDPDGSGLTSVYFKSDLDGRTFEQKITDAMAAAIADTIAAENVASEGAFDEVIAAIEEPIAEVVEDVVTSTSTDTGTGVTTTTTTTVTTNPVTGAKTATTTTTQTDGETTTTTKEETDTLPFIPEPSFPLIPPFDTAIDVPEKEPIPMQAWRDMIPFMDVLEGTKVEATGGVCLLTITTNQFGSWDLDFCSWDTHLQWLGNFIYIFACFVGLRMVLTGRE